MNKFLLSKMDKYLINRDIEELSELITELSKISNDRGDMYHLIEEFADVKTAMSHIQILLLNDTYHLYHLIEEFADVKTAMSHIQLLFKITDKQIEEVQKRKGVFKKYD